MEEFNVEALEEFDCDELETVFEDNSSRAGSELSLSAQIMLDSGITHSTNPTKRDYLHALHVANAAKQIREIPDAGGTLHAIMRGDFNAWDLMPALLTLANPSVCESLYIATLSFNARNLAELVQLFDRRKILAVAFICSVFFEDMTGKLYDALHYQLVKRKQRCIAVRSHAKVFLLQLSDGRHLTIESSANLRSCNNIEQFTLTNDRSLWEFHRNWMEELHAKNAERKKAETASPARRRR